MGLEDRLAKIEETLGKLRSERLRTDMDTLDAAAFLVAQLSMYLEGTGMLDIAGMRTHAVGDMDRHGDERIARINATRSLLRQLDGVLAARGRSDLPPGLPV